MKNRLPLGGGFKTTVAFLFICDFWTFPGGLGKKLKEVGVPKNRRWGNRGLGGIDLMPTVNECRDDAQLGSWNARKRSGNE